MTGKTDAAQRGTGLIEALPLGDVVTFHHRHQVPGRADDERGIDMAVVEEVAYLPDSGGQRMPRGGCEHRIGNRTQDLIHRFRLVRCLQPRPGRLLTTAAASPASTSAIRSRRASRLNTSGDRLSRDTFSRSSPAARSGCATRARPMPLMVSEISGRGSSAAVRAMIVAAPGG